jgi:hypothetical protein
MSSRGASLAIGLIIAVGILISLTFVSLNVSFPFHEIGAEGHGSQLVPIEPYKDIAPSVSRFMWETRGQDVALQSFVIFASVICCLAMLKEDDTK